MDNQWIIHELSMGYPWIIHGSSMDYQWKIHEHQWISMDCKGWGNRPAHLGGTARAILGEPLGRGRTTHSNKESKNPSGKPGWGKTTTTKLVAIRFVVLMCFFGRDSLSDPLQEFSSNTFASPRQPGRLLDAPFSMVRDCMGECVWHAAHPTHAQILA